MQKAYKYAFIGCFYLLGLSSNSLVSNGFSLWDPESNVYETEPVKVHHLMVKLYRDNARTFKVIDAQKQRLTLKVIPNQKAQAKLIGYSKIGWVTTESTIKLKKALKHLNRAQRNRTLEATLEHSQGIYSLRLLRMRGEGELATSLTIKCTKVDTSAVASRYASLVRRFSVGRYSPPSLPKRSSINI